MESPEGDIDHLLSLLTCMTKNKIQRVIKWARKHEKIKTMETKFVKNKYNSHQIAALVFLYESAHPEFLTIGEILCDLDTAENNFLVPWLRETFYFNKEDMYVAFQTWMMSGSHLGCYIAFDLNRTYEIIQEAAYKGDNVLLKWLLSRNVDIDFRDSSRNTALHIAANEGHKETVKCLLENGASIFVLNSELRTPFHIALESWKFDICDILCPPFIEKFITDNMFLDVVEEGNHRALQYILKKNGWCSIWRAILIAVEKDFPQVLETLLYHCPSVHLVPNEYNNKVLTKAIEKGDLIILEKLLAAGFQMEDTLINFARENRKEEILNRFDQKSKIDTVD